MIRRLFHVAFLTSLLFLAACQQVPPPTAVPTSSLAPTPTLAASFTPTQRSTVTTTATASPTARPSPSVIPTASNTPSASPTPASDLLSQLATAPALPVLEHPSLPTAVLVFQNASNHLALFDREGQILHTMDKMGMDPVGFNPDDYQVIGPISPVDQTVPLALLSLYNFGQIQIWEHQQYTKKIPAPDIIALKSAPGQSIIAYGTFHPNTGETARSELFLIPVDDPPADPSPLIQAMLPGSYGLYPVAVHARGSTSLGVWLTQQINGIGGWNFDVDRGLAYVDAATGRSIQALPEELVFKGLSPDYRYAAFTAEGKVFLRNLLFNEEVNLPTLPESSNGVGYLTFSPDNRLAAWTETTGDPYTTPSTLRSWLRIASIRGELRFSLESTTFSEAAGFQPDWIQPLGWLEDGTLLIQAREDTSRKSVLLRFDAASGQAAFFIEGQFAGWVYE